MLHAQNLTLAGGRCIFGRQKLVGVVISIVVIDVVVAVFSTTPPKEFT